MTWEGTPELDAVLAKARNKLEGNGLHIDCEVKVRASARHPNLWRLARAAVQRSRANSETLDVSFSLTDLDEWLSKPHNGGRTLIETLDAQEPLVDKLQLEAADEADMTSGLRVIDAILSDDRHRTRRTTLRQSRGLLGHIRSGAAVNAARVLTKLPADGISVTTLAEASTGDTKALKDSGTLGLVLRTLAAELELPNPTTAEERAEIWSAFGVGIDALSSTVLVLGLRTRTTNTLGRILNLSSDEGEPVVLTLSQLKLWPIVIDSPHVFVCENPAVMSAAAKRSGTLRYPLVCTQGVPSLAVYTLLANATGIVHWRGDFDWTGLRTTRMAIRRLDAEPWRMDHDTYLAGLSRGESEAFKSKDSPCDSAWDPMLAPAMAESGRAVMEERLIDILLEDLH